jgi:hypothetical protein
MTPEVCPVCGATVPPNAKACPGCGADEETGWSEEARTDELGLPDENFDYEEFVKREFGGEKKSPIPHGIHWFWWIVAVLILAAFLWMLLK